MNVLGVTWYVMESQTAGRERTNILVVSVSSVQSFVFRMYYICTRMLIKLSHKAFNFMLYYIACICYSLNAFRLVIN